MRTVIRYLVATFALTSASLLAGSGLQAETKTRQTTLKDVVGEIAEDIRKWMNESGGKSEISVGSINPPAGTTTGLGIGQLLTNELRLANLIVKLGNAPHSVEGKITLDKANGDLVLQIVVCDDSGVEKYRVPTKRIPLVTEVAVGDTKASGASGDFLLAAGITAPGNISVPKLKVPESLIGIDGTKVFAQGAPLYRLEIQKKVADNDYTALTPRIQDGFAVVKMNRDTIFGVNLINDSNEDVAVILEIDGVNFFVLCDARTTIETKSGKVSLSNYTHYVINKKQAALIAGWYKNESTTLEFHATDDPELKNIAPGLVEGRDPARLGTITAQFYRAWAEPKDQPEDALLASKFRGSAAKAGGLFVVPGKQTDVTKSELRTVRWEEFNRATISVRYEK